MSAGHAQIHNININTQQSTNISKFDVTRTVNAIVIINIPTEICMYVYEIYVCEICVCECVCVWFCNSRISMKICPRTRPVYQTDIIELTAEACNFATVNIFRLLVGVQNVFADVNSLNISFAGKHAIF